jgi:hypothetical protein
VPPRVHGHHQIRSPNPINPILFALCSPSLPLLATPFGSPPSPTLQLLVAHQFDPLFSYITHLAPRSHTLHTHTHTLHSSLHPHGDTSSNLDFTSPLIHLDERGCAAFSSRLNLITPPSFPLGSHLETRHDASCPSTLYRHLALSVPPNNTNSRYTDIVVSLVLSTDII